MKKILKNVFQITVGVLFLTSCKDSNMVQGPLPNTKIVDFQKQKVLLRDDVSESDLSNFVNFSLPDISTNKRARQPENYYNELSLISGKEILNIINQEYKNYPNFGHKQFTETEQLFIKKYFPNLKNTNDIENARSVIYDYVEILLSKDVSKAIKEYVKKKKGAKVAYVLNPTENYVKIQYPISAINVNFAANEATDAQQHFYGNIDNDVAGNAFRHFCWSALSVGKIADQTANKWKGLDRAKQFQTAHEYHANLPFYRNFTLYNYMDLNNNLAGRTYMYQSIGQNWLGLPKNIPLNPQIYSQAINNCTYNYKTNVAAILAININYSENNLGDYENAWDYFTPTQNYLVYVQ